MKFTYDAYREMIALLREAGYVFRNYHDGQKISRCVILRHDIDTCLAQAVKLAEVEAELGVCSTWFVLLRTDFYNVASRQGQAQLRRILELGHEIGLHFDEVAYGRELTAEETSAAIQKECGILSELLDTPVTTVSMHRPSKATLEADLQIPGIVNSYGKTFFRDFKYLSDSRCHWREPVLDIIRSGDYDRLHILTHAFWYHEGEQSIEETISTFLSEAEDDRCVLMGENIRDFSALNCRKRRAH